MGSVACNAEVSGSIRGLEDQKVVSEVSSFGVDFDSLVVIIPVN